ncbi:hypothetical protein K438DRAFT_1855753 [Mycena galopus ATCC 62051]|nr:hypothetical protein K438DRAFT_1855753 [Mycena galopus ATCC 62051]
MVVLPPELEREIFEVAALSHFNTIPSLLRVARRVLEWIEPLLYRVIVIDQSTRAQACHRILALKPNLLANGVEHLLFLDVVNTWPEEDLRALFRLCALRLLSLARVPRSLLPLPVVLTMSRLHRWTGNLDFLFGGRPAIDLSIPAFRAVTHMDVFDHIEDNDTVICSGLAALPCLTHLCLNNRVPDLVPRRILAECLHLEVLVCMLNPFTGHSMADNPPTTDVRFVVSAVGNYWRDWEVGAQGGTDFWVAADEFVAQKRLGEIEASCYLLRHE